VLHFFFLAPLSPRFIAEQCLCHDEQSNTISGTLAWSMRDVGAIQGFILELDDGTFVSDFRVRKKKSNIFFLNK
jgi:hypothetical protein